MTSLAPDIMAGGEAAAPGSATTASSVLMIASHFPPLNAAGVFRSLRFARYLPELGWNVHVLTIAPRAYAVGDKCDAGLLAKVPSSVAVHRTAAVYPARWPGACKQWLRGLVRGQGGDRGGAGQLDAARPQRAQPASGSDIGVSGGRSGWLQVWKDAVTLPLQTPDHWIGWRPFAVWRGRRVIREHGVQVLYSSGPPWTNHLIGCRLKQLTGAPWVADFRDPWVNADFKRWRMGDTWVGRQHQRLERQVLQQADQVLVNTRGSLQDLLDRHGELVADKCSLLPNGFDPEDFAGLTAERLPGNSAWGSDVLGSQPLRGGMPLDRKLVVAHAGSFYGSRNIDALIAAVGNLHRQRQVAPGELEIRLLGALRPDRDHEQRAIHEAGVEPYFTLTGLVPHGDCLRRLAEADLLLLVQVGAPISVPGKVYEYIALGRPMLVLATPGATTELAAREQLGRCVAPDDVAGVEAALRHYLQCRRSAEISDHVSLEVQQRYNGRLQTGQLDRILRTAMLAAAANSLASRGTR